MSEPDVIRLFARSRSGLEYELDVNKAFQFADIEKTLNAFSQLDRDRDLDLFFKGARVDKSRTLGELGVQDGDTLVFGIAALNRREYAIAGREQVSRNRSEPPDFGRKVELLMGLGDFSREQCEAALREASFNPDTASYYLLTNQITGAGPVVEGRLSGRVEIPVAVPKVKREEKKAEDEAPLPFERLSEKDKEDIREIAAECGSDIGTVYQLWCVAGGNLETTRNLVRDDE
jgi:hypothetical protein